ncbi:MAG TPA: hypothetical protein VN643_19660 [Pyrinomonadaceae bacterium]|nr:hypothetical protein [Pyrinomonadaceae bacterium]
MTRSILRIGLTALAFVMLFAGSLNLNRTNANVPPAGGKCGDYCGCPGGTYVCCIIHLPDGTDIECGMP